MVEYTDPSEVSLKMGGPPALFLPKEVVTVEEYDRYSKQYWTTKRPLEITLPEDFQNVQLDASDT